MHPGLNCRRASPDLRPGSRLLVTAVLLAFALLVAGCVPAPTPTTVSAAATVPALSPSPAPADESAAVTRSPSPSPTNTPPATPTASSTPAATATPVPTATLARQTPPAFATPAVNIIVTSPVANQTLQSPVRIVGIARVFEASVSYEIAAGSRQLAAGFTMASMGAPEWGTFQVEVPVASVATPTKAIVRVFTHSMKDGSIQDLVEVPITIEPGGLSPPPPVPTRVGTGTASATRQVTIYLVRRVGSGEIYVAVSRQVPHTQAIGTAAIQALLAGPVIEERMQGLDSPIPDGTTLRSLRIVDGVAYADFDRRLLEHDGGAARAKSIARVVALTLEQFSTVREVVLSVEGRTEGVVQP